MVDMNALDEMKQLNGHMGECMTVQPPTERTWIFATYDTGRGFVQRGKTNALGTMGDGFSKAKRIT